MSKVYEIAFQMGGQITGAFSKTMRGANAALGDLQKNITQLNSEASDITKLQGLQRSVGKLWQEYNQAKTAAEQLGAELAQTANPTKKQQQEFNRATAAAEKLKNKLSQQDSQLQQLRGSLNAAGMSTKDLAARQQNLIKTAERARAAQASLQKTMAAQQKNLANRDNYRGQLLDAAALAATFAAPIRAAAGFESAMADVNKVVDQTAAESAQMSQEIINMSRRIPITAQGLAQIVAAGGQAGIARKDLAAFAESAAQMGVAFDITADQAGEMMAKWRTAFKLSQDEVVALADQVNYLSNTTAASAPKISDVVTRVGGLGKLAGLGSGEVAALAASLVATGAPSEVAATGLQNMMLALTAGASATNAQSEALAMLGYDAQEMATMMQQDAQGAIISVLNAVRELDAEEQPAVLTEIFGKESIKSIGQLVNNTDLLVQNFKNVGDAGKYAGSMTKEFETRAKTTDNNLQLLGNRVTALGISLGNILLPGVNAVVGAIGPMIDKVADLTHQYPQLTKIVIGTATALAALKVATIAGGYAWTFVMGPILKVQKVIKTLRIAYMLSTGAIAANTATSKAAIVTAKLFAASQWLLNAAVGAGKWVWATAKIIAFTAVSKAAAIGSKAMAAAQWLLNAALTANPIGVVIAAIAALVAAGIWLYKNWGTVTEFFSKAWQMMKDAAVAAWNGVVSLVKLGFNNLKELFFTFHPLGWMMGGFNKLDAFLSNFSLYESGKKIMQTIGDGILAKARAVIDSVKGVFQKVREYLPFSDAKVGPLSDLTKSGSAIMSTLAAGIDKSDAMEVSVNRNMTSTNSAIGGGSGGLLGKLMNSVSSIGVGGGGGNTIQVTVQQTISVGGDASSNVREQAAAGAREGVDNLASKLEELMSRNRRLSYG